MAYSEQTLKELGELFLEVAHGDDREAIVTAVQKKRPDFKAPDVEISRLKKDMDTRFESEKAEKQKEQMNARLEKQRQDLIDSGRYSSEDVGKIETYMQERGIGDYDDGATLYGARHAPAAATSEIKTSRWEMPSFKGLMENPNAWAANEAAKTIAEFKNNRR